MNETPVAKPYKGRPHKPRRPRLSVDLWCEILGARDRAVGHIRNLNIGGCRILSPSAFPIRETVSLVLSGPPSGPDLHLKAELRWLALNPSEGPFELGCQFVHSGESARQVERMLKVVLRRTAPVATDRRAPPVYAKFAGGLDEILAPGGQNAGDLRRTIAAEGLDRLINPDPSAPLP